MTPPILLRQKGSETILSRNAQLSTASLTSAQSKVDTLVSEGTAVLTSYKTLVGLGAFGLAARVGLGSGILVRGQMALSELSLGVRSFALATRGVPALGGLTALLAAGCSEAPEGMPDPEIPPGSMPPPGTDEVCDDRRTEVLNSAPDASLSSLVNSITFPTLDFTVGGTSIWNDTNGNPVTSITPSASDVVSYQKVGDRLFVLTANSVSGAYAPATLLVYKVNADNSLTPVTTDSYINGGASNAILLGYYNPVALAKLEGGNELDVIFGAPNPGIVSTVDPYGMRVFESDWCSTHTAVSDGGVGGADGGVDGAGGG